MLYFGATIYLPNHIENVLRVEAVWRDQSVMSFDSFRGAIHIA
jgi:hypothetical protein